LLNAENIGLEPVWPYSLITPDGPLFETAVRTYEHRPFRDLATWSYDSIQAARLGLGAEMANRLDALTQIYQLYPNGMAEMMGNSGEFYIEQMGIVSVALAEALVQDQGDIIRIAPAIPPDWTVHGTVYVRGNARVTVTAVAGKVTAFELAAASTHTFHIANPWPPGKVFAINTKAGGSYAYTAPNAARAESNATGATAPSAGSQPTIALGAPTTGIPPTAMPGAPSAGSQPTIALGAPTARIPPTAMPGAPTARIPPTAMPGAPTAGIPPTAMPGAPTAGIPPTAMPGAPTAGAPTTHGSGAPTAVTDATRPNSASQTNTLLFAPGPTPHPKSLGRAAIGIPEPCCAPPPGYDPAADRYSQPKPESH
jgi:hypothetical protein